MKRRTSMLSACALLFGGLLLSSTECGNSSSNSQPTRDGGSSGSASGAGSGTSGASTGSGSGTGATSGSGASGAGATTDAAGDSATSDSSTGTVDTTVDVLMRNKHPSRDGVYVQPTLTKANVGTMALDTTFASDSGATFSGPLMWAQPLYLSKGPGTAGIFLVVTTGNNVYALDETTGATVWMVNLGAVQMINMATCVDSITRGILSTPVIDPTPGPDGFPTMYVSAYVATTTVESLVFALSTKDGSTRAGWPVHVNAIQAAAAADAGVTNFLAEAQNQRGALALVNGILYVGYGSHGDCGSFHGSVVAINTADPTMTGVWMTADPGGAIWAPGGLASDGDGIITVTSNGTADAGVHMDSEQVTRLRGMATLTRTSANTFYPTGSAPQPLWQTLDQTDQDLGSTNPVVLSAGGTTYVTAAGKNGEFFLLNAANFGGTDPGNFVPPGGAYLKIAPDKGKTITVPAAYTSSSGTHVVLTVAHPLGCPAVVDDGGAGADGGADGGGDGGAGGPVVMSILVTPGTPPSLNVAWCSPAGAPSPIVTTSDGTSDYIVWFVNAGVLTGVDADTGATLVTATGTCPNTRRWTSPIAVKGRIISAADGHLCSWSVH